MFSIQTVALFLPDHYFVKSEILNAKRSGSRPPHLFFDEKFSSFSSNIFQQRFVPISENDYHSIKPTKKRDSSKPRCLVSAESPNCLNPVRLSC